jgi:hypothetical protein
VTGFASQGKAESVTQGVPTTGRIPNGGLIEREGPGRFADEKVMVLELRNPDFNTAVTVADAINAYSQQRFGIKVAREDDLRTVTLQRPFYIGAARFMAEIGELAVQADVPARVVIDERTGTIVIGKDVQISTVAVAHGNLTVRVTETPKASQPSRSRAARPSSRRKRRSWSESRVAISPSCAAPTCRRWSAGSTGSASSQSASSPSCRPSSRQARCRRTWWCNEVRFRSNETDGGDGVRAAFLGMREHLAAVASPALAQQGWETVVAAVDAVPPNRATTARRAPSPAMEAFIAPAQFAAQQPKPATVDSATTLPRAPKPAEPPPLQTSAARQYCVNIANAAPTRGLPGRRRRLPTPSRSWRSASPCSSRRPPNSRSG